MIDERKTFLICDKTSILEIVDNIFLDDEKYKNNSIFEVLSDSTTYNVGDDLLVKDNNLRNRKIVTQSFGDRTRLESPQRPKIDWEIHLNNVDINKINQLKDKIEKIRNDKDIFYRIVHHSFKMYHARDYILELSQLMIELVSQEEYKITTYKDLYNKMEELDFHFVVRNLIEKSLSTEFNNHRNYHQSWIEDATSLFSALSIVLESANFLTIFYEEFYEKRSFLHLGSHYITEQQAGAMAVWGGIKGLRSLTDEEKKRILS